MKSFPEILVDGITARKQLSPKGDPARPLGATRFAAIKKAMGLTGRHVSVAAIQRFLKAHPNFSETQIYGRKAGAARTRALAIGATIELRHGRWVYPFHIEQLDATGKPERLTQVAA